MQRLPPEVLYGLCSVSPLDLPKNNLVALGVVRRLTRMRLEEVKARRYTHSDYQKLQISKTRFYGGL